MSIDRQVVAAQHRDEETNTSIPWYLSILSFLLMSAGAMQESGEGVSEDYFPNNPANKTVLFGMSGWSAALKVLSPLFLGLLWVNMGRSLWNLYKADNRNFERYLDAGISVITTVGWTALYIVAASAAAYVAAHVVPILVASLLAVNAAYCLFNCCKNLYYAWNAPTPEERNEYLWKAGKQLLGIVTNIVGMVAGLALGIKPDDALEVIAESFEKGRKAIAAFGALVFASVVMETASFNNETFDILRNPRKAWADARAEISAQPSMFRAGLAIGKMIGIGLLRLIASPLLILQAPVMYYRSRHVSSPPAENTVQTPAPSGIAAMPVTQLAAPQLVLDVKAVSDNKEKEFKELVAQIRHKIGLLTEENAGASNSGVRTAKILLLQNILQKKLGVTAEQPPEKICSARFNASVSLDTLVKDAKDRNRNVFRSFFRRKGDVQRLVEDTDAFVRRHSAAPAA
jgi:hypothetical protein